MKQKVVLVHGFNVRDGGKRSIDTLAPLIKRSGYEVDVDEADYGFFNLLMVRIASLRARKGVISRLAKAFETADIIITHSNGANFTTKALEMLDKKFTGSKLVIHISPALNRDTKIPNAVLHQLVLHTHHDKAVIIASLLLFHPWGSMGAFGYNGKDPRNTNCRNHDVKGHSAWFRGVQTLDTWYDCLRWLRKVRGK